MKRPFSVAGALALVLFANVAVAESLRVGHTPYLVTPAEALPATRRFIEFMRSEQEQRVLREAEVLPVSP
jgi:hypothetical protein